MKVVILGPIVNEKLSGGVGVFDESLCKGFVDSGDEAYIISVGKSKLLNNIVVGKGDGKSKRIYFSFRKIAKILKKISPDLVIASLQYTLGIKKYKKYCKTATFVEVLHGFPCPSNGRFKAWCVNTVARYSSKHFDKVVTVSFLSYAINKKINRVICDRVIHNGCNLVSSESKEKIYDVVYVGRLFRDKEIEMIGEAFKIVKERNNNLRLLVVGYGEFYDDFATGRFANCGIEFLGKKTQAEVKDILSQTKCFISMNPLEPFGTVFNEALVNGCNIITQTTTGGAPLFMDKNYFHKADCTNKVDLANVIENAIDKYTTVSEKEKQEFIDYLDYKRVVKEYKELIKR